MDNKGADRRIAALAGEQDGVVSLEQLTAAGLTASAIARRVAAGRLHRIFPGVYAVGHARLSLRGRRLAAVLASGPAAVLSHRDAGALWGVRPSSRAQIDVSTPHRGRKGTAGIDLHRPRGLDPADVAEVDGIPVTTVGRTLVDLTDVVPADHVHRAAHEAEVLRVFDAVELAGAIERARGRRRLAPLRAILAGATDAPPTRSELEGRFLGLCHRAGLPMPQVGVVVSTPGASFEVDFLWPQHGLVVETDGVATHMTRRSFEDDRRRDVELALAGLRVVRFTWDRIARHPAEVIAALATLLATTQPPNTFDRLRSAL